ncbi:MAG: PrgI family protein [bacterium]
MQQFVVPQFIDVEDKIIGPITTRQFLIILATLLVDFVAYKLATFVFFIFLFLIITGFGIILSFAKVNGQPFHLFLLNLVQTLKRPKLRVWFVPLINSELKVFAASAPPPAPKVVVNKERPTASKLSDLALLVNTGGVYKPEE